MSFFIKLFASGLGTGYFPILPGTVGSLIAIPLIVALSPLPLLPYGIVIAVFTLFSCWVADRAQSLYGCNDPTMIVIDEIAGMLCAFIGHDINWLTLATGFIVFRGFDIWKPYPAGWLDKKLHNGYGVVLDDVVAGLYTNAVLWMLTYLFPNSL